MGHRISDQSSALLSRPLLSGCVPADCTCYGRSLRMHALKHAACPAYSATVTTTGRLSLLRLGVDTGQRVEWAQSQLKPILPNNELHCRPGRMRGARTCHWLVIQLAHRQGSHIGWYRVGTDTLRNPAVENDHLHASAPRGCGWGPGPGRGPPDASQSALSG